MLKPCAKSSDRVGLEVRIDLLVHGRLHLVGEQERDELRSPDRVRR